MKISETNIGALIPDDKNLNKGTEYGQHLIENSMRQFGAGRSILLDKNNRIIAGNKATENAGAVGIEDVIIVETDGTKLVAVKRMDIDLDSKEGRELALADNATQKANLAWDEGMIKEVSAEYDIEIENWGVQDFAEEEVVVTKEVSEDNFEIPQKTETDIKEGDIFEIQIGGNKHRLMCGNSTSPENMEVLMRGARADLVFTDPPYGMKKEADGVLGDNMNYDDLLAFNAIWIKLSFDYLKDVGSWYCFGTDEPLMDIYSSILKPLIRQNKITFRNLITWDKGSGQGQNSNLCRMYATADEKCLFVMAGVQGFNTNTDNYFDKWDTVRLYLMGEADKVGLTAAKLKSICGVGMYSHWFSKSQWQLITEEHYVKLQKHFNGDAFKKEYDALKKEYLESRAYFNNTHDNMNNVWHFFPTSQKERETTGGHATPKPIALCARGIKSSSREGEIVLDMFGGAGSTLMASEQLNRICYTMELSPEYCQVIINRARALFSTADIKKLN